MRLKKIIIIMCVVFVGMSALTTGTVSLERGYDILRNDVRKVGKVGTAVVSLLGRTDDDYDETVTYHSDEPPIYDYTWGSRLGRWYLLDTNDPEPVLYDRYIRHTVSDGHYRFSLDKTVIDNYLAIFPRKSDIYCGGR